MATRIDGKAVAAKVRAEVAAGVGRLKVERGAVPGLAVVRVGDDPASQLYVGSKKKAALEVGFQSWEYHHPATASHEEIRHRVLELNRRPDVHGILVQLPLPKQVRAEEIVASVSPEKDVDGLHPVNAGLLSLGRPGIRPCTPLGVMRLLEEYEIPLAGRKAVVVGRSSLVGRPVAALLLERDATVTVCHRKSDVQAEVERADIVVVAVGVPEVIKGAWIREGATVIDVGQNRLADGKVVGDVEFAAAEKRASHITPVPGGVGPMTVAMLLQNTLRAAERRG